MQGWLKVRILVSLGPRELFKIERGIIGVIEVQLSSDECMADLAFRGVFTLYR